MNGLLISSKSNPCLVCGDESGKCRHKPDSLNYWQCMSCADTKFGELVNGFKSIGNTKDGLWGQFVIESYKGFQKPAAIQNRTKDTTKTQANSLPIDARDIAIRKLHNHFGLSARHKEDLINRGLSNEAIERNLYFFITPDQEIPAGIPSNLPGISYGRIKAAGSGYACVTFDPDGKATGWQIRLDGACDNKYRWAKGMASSHLENGELPITSAYPLELKRSFIGMGEGVNKATVAAHRLGQIFIGAASANFAASPQQTRKHLEEASQHLGGTKRVEWAADAGSINNPCVLKAYIRAWDLIEEWGYEVVVPWWGQTDKTHPDIDELQDYSQIQYISTQEFLSFSSAGKDLPKTYKKIIDVKPTGRATQNTRTTKKIIEVAPTGRIVGGVQLKAIRSTREEFLPTFAALSTEAGQDWLKMRDFTPDVTIDSQYFDWESGKPGSNLAIKSGLGTGKSHHVHSKFLADNNVGAVALGYRNALLVQFTERGNNWHGLQQDLKGSKEDMALLSDPQSRISTCVDSLIYFQGHQFQDKRLILDEIEGSVKHLYESKTAVSMHRQVCKERMGESVSEAEAVILLDGNLTNLTVAHIERISGKKFLKIENKYKGNRGHITFYNGSQKTSINEETGETTTTEKRLDDYSLLQQIMLEDTQHLVCGSDSQEKLETWEEGLKVKGHKTFRLDSTNSNTPEAKAFLCDPAKYIVEHEITAVLYSPTAESGLSIDLHDYFVNSYYFFFGVVSTNEQCQFLARPRDPKIKIHVFCQTRGMQAKSEAITSQDLQRLLVEYVLECSRVSLSGLEEADKSQRLLQLAAELVQRSSDPHFEYECHLQAKSMFEQANLRNCFEYAARDAGYTLDVVTGRKASKKEMEAQQQAVRVRKAEEIFSAKNLTPEEAAQKSRSYEATRQDKVEVAKHRILQRLPGIENKTAFVTTKVTVTREEAEEIQSGNVSEKTYQKLGISSPETLANQGVEPGHISPVISIEKPAGCGPDLEGNPDEIEVTIQQEKPVLDADFIRKIKFEDRALLGRIEAHFSLTRPDIVKEMGQRRWYKKLSLFVDPEAPSHAKRLNLSTYKSEWLKLKTLQDMGIDFFLNPESRWSDESEEVLSFWERGKDARTANFIGIQVGNNKPCQYIGRVLAKFDLKTKREKVKGVRSYRLDTEYLHSPIRQAIFDCVQQKVLSAFEQNAEKLDWNVILETAQNQGVSSAEMPTVQGVEPGHISPVISIEKSVGCGPDLGGSRTLTEELVEAFEFVDSAEMFAIVTEDVALEIVEEAIALAGSQPMRSQLREWYENSQSSSLTSNSAAVDVVESTMPVMPKIGQVFKRWSNYLGREVHHVVRSIEDGLVEFADGIYESVMNLLDATCYQPV